MRKVMKRKALHTSRSYSRPRSRSVSPDLGMKRAKIHHHEPVVWQPDLRPVSPLSLHSISPLGSVASTLNDSVADEESAMIGSTFSMIKETLRQSIQKALHTSRSYSRPRSRSVSPDLGMKRAKIHHHEPVVWQPDLRPVSPLSLHSISPLGSVASTLNDSVADEESAMIGSTFSMIKETLRQSIQSFPSDSFACRSSLDSAVSTDVSVVDQGPIIIGRTLSVMKATLRQSIHVPAVRRSTTLDINADKASKALNDSKLHQLNRWLADVYADPEPVEVLSDPEAMEILSEPELVKVLREPKTKVLRDPKTAEVLSDPEEAEMLSDPEEAEVLRDPEVLSDPEPKEVLSDPEPAEVLTEPEPTEVLLEPETEDVLIDSEPEEVLPDPKTATVLPYQEPAYVLPDPKIEKILPDSESMELLPDPKTAELLKDLKTTKVLLASDPAHVFVVSDEKKTVVGSESADLLFNPKPELLPDTDPTDMLPDPAYMLQEPADVLVQLEPMVSPDPETAEMLPDSELVHVLPNQEPADVLVQSEPKMVLPDSDPVDVLPDLQLAAVLPGWKTANVLPDTEPMDVLPDRKPVEILSDMETEDVLVYPKTAKVLPDPKIAKVLRNLKTQHNPSRLQKDTVKTPNYESIEYDSDLDDDFDIDILNNSRIARNIPQDEELNDKDRRLIHSLEKAIDEAVERLVGVSTDFHWQSDFDTFEGCPETFKEPTPGAIQDYDTPYDAFVSIWSNDIMEHIVKETNRYAKESIEAEKRVKVSLLDVKWVDTNVDEMYTFFGLTILMGLDPRISKPEYWREGSYLELSRLRQIMSYNRFTLLNKFLHFVDNADESQPLPQTGEFSPTLRKIAPIVTHLNDRFMALYNVAQNIVIGESEQCPQVIWSKSGHLGLRSYELCDSHTGYSYKFLIYKDKHAEVDVSPTSAGKGTQIVLELLNGLENKGHCVTVDNVFNSPVLARYLKSKGFDCLGTLRVNRKHVPKDISKLPTDMPKGAIVARHSGDVACIAWKDTKLVTIISTFHSDLTFERKAQSKPVAVQVYNNIMQSIDEKDQKLSMYSFERERPAKWYIKLFKRLLNASVHNAMVLVNSARERRDRPSLTERNFREYLSDAIIKRHSSHRRLRTLQPFAVEERLRKDAKHTPVGVENEQYCHICRRLGKRSPVYMMCAHCDEALCFGKCWEVWHSLKRLPGRNVLV